MCSAFSVAIALALAVLLWSVLDCLPSLLLWFWRQLNEEDEDPVANVQP